MAELRPFRFGVGNESGARSRAAWDTLVRRAEALGYAILLVSDHYSTNVILPLVALMAAADAAPTIRIGSYVFDNDFRHPAQLAKEAATLDLLSEGRFELGIGAGWDPADYEQVGLPFDRAGVRIERLAEGVAIIKQFFTQESVTFAGTHYRVTGLPAVPKPVQRPHPSIFIGGGGKRVLSLAAREADIVGITPKINADGTVDASERTEAALERKVAWIRQAAGERFASLELNLQVGVAITMDLQQAAEGLVHGHYAGLGVTDITADVILASPYWLIGNVDQVVDQVHRLRETFGISYLMVGDYHMEAFAPVVARLAGT
jgi:probable F420-dependent oxidoreductase